MEKQYSIQVHPLPAGYEYFCDDWEDGATYPERYDIAEALDDRIRIRQPETGLEGFCDSYGNVIVPCVYDAVGEYYEGISIVQTEVQPYRDSSGGTIHRLYGGIDREGRVVIPLVYERLCDMVLGFSVACRDGKWGMIDHTGAIAASFIYEYMEDDMDWEYYTTRRPHAVKRAGKYGCLSRYGQEVVPCEHDSRPAAYWAGSFAYSGEPIPYDKLYNEFPYEMFHLGPFHFIRSEYERPIAPDYHKILTADGDADMPAPEKRHVAVTEYDIFLKNNRSKLGLMDEAGRIVLPAEYEDMRYAQGEGPRGFTARRDGRWYFIELVEGIE